MFLRILLLSFVLLLFKNCTNKSTIFIKSFSPSIHKESFIFNDSVKGIYFHTALKTGNDSLLLFIIGGSGHASMRYTLANYAKALKQINASVYALQKRYVSNREIGTGKMNHAFSANYYFTQMAADQECFIKSILSKKENADKRVILLGISEGATIAAKVASEIPEVNYLAIIGSGGLTQAEELKLLYPMQAAKLDSLYNVIKKYPRAIDTMAIGYSYRYWADILFVNPTDYFLKLNIPIILAMGEKDKNAPIESARFLQTTFLQKHKNNLFYYEYKDCDHFLTDSQGMNHLPNFFSQLQTLLIKQ